jgi:hypothetical protein
MPMPKPKSPEDLDWDEAEELIRLHRLHIGVYNRVAEKLGVHASYVSRVAKGVRSSEAILQALVEELSSISPPPKRLSRKQF